MPNTLPNGDMVHEEIEAQNIAERYLMGKLSADESERFEEHFVDCPQCQERLEATERLRAALKSVSPEKMPVFRAGPAPPVRPGGWPRAAWLIAAALVIAAGLSAILAIQLARMGRDLEQAKVASLDWRHRYETEHAASEALRLPTANQPVAGPTFYLATTRGGAPGDSNPGTRVDVPSNARWVILALDRETAPGYRSLRATLKDSSGKEVWQQSGLPAGSRRPLSVVLPSELLATGKYVLTLEGLSSDGRYQAEGAYRFQVTKP